MRFGVLPIRILDQVDRTTRGDGGRSPAVRAAPCRPERRLAALRERREPGVALERERIRLGRSGVNAADVLDGAGGEEETLGEGGLTGVDVGEDAEIERAHGASCRARRCGPSGWTWVLPSRSFLVISWSLAAQPSHGRSSAGPSPATAIRWILVWRPGSREI